MENTTFQWCGICPNCTDIENDLDDLREWPYNDIADNQNIITWISAPAGIRQF